LLGLDSRPSVFSLLLELATVFSGFYWSLGSCDFFSTGATLEWICFLGAFPFCGARSEGSSLTMEAGGVGAFQTNSNYTPAKLSHGGRSQFDPGRVYSRCSTTQSIKKR